jgi:hypothetical protein
VTETIDAPKATIYYAVKAVCLKLLIDIPYYVELQRRMLDIFRYVSCHETNFDAHSVMVESLLVDTCTFFDSLCQTFIREKSEAGFTFQQESLVDNFNKKVSGTDSSNFNCRDYSNLLEADFVLSKREVNLNTYEDSLILNPTHYHPDKISGYLITPFREWASGGNLPWWGAFTALKHNRLRNFREAKLGNLILAMAAAFIMLTLRNEAEFKAGSITPELYDLFFPKYWTWKGKVSPGNFMWT